MSADVLSELEAIDEALIGAPVPARHARLAELVQEVRSARPRPSDRFVQALDARAAKGFRSDDPAQTARRTPSEPTSRRRRQLPHVHDWSAVRAQPALGLALVAALAVAVAVPFAPSGAGHRGVVHAPGRAAQSGPATAAERQAKSAHSTLKPAEHARSENSVAASPPSSGAPTARPRQVERAATLDVGVAPNAIESTAHQVFTLASAFDGYVRQSNVSSGGPGQGGASFDLRIPSSNLTGAIAALSHLGHVRSENDATNDVTNQFNSLQGSLDDLKAERASLLRQLTGTSDPQASATLKARLQLAERRISQLGAELGALRSRVTYTALALSLSAENTAASKRGDLTPGEAAEDAAQILQGALAVVVLGAAVLLPTGVIVMGAWMLITSSRRRLREEALDASR